MKRGLGILTVAVLALLVIAVPAMAQGSGGGRVTFGEDIIIRADEVVTGDIAAFGGNITIEAGGEVTGNVVAFGGQVVNGGSISGDLVAFGGNVVLGDNSNVAGQVIHLGGSVDQSESAHVGRGVTGGVPFTGTIGPVFRPVGFGGSRFDPVGNVIGLILIAALALLLASVMPKPLHVAAETVAREPWLSVGVGLLALVIALPLSILLLITICLIPVSIVFWLALIAAGLMGWVVVGMLVGSPILHALRAHEHTGAMAAVVGVAVLTVLTWIPCVGFLLSVAVGALGIGGVALTMFGTRPYHPRVGMYTGPRAQLPPAAPPPTPPTSLWPPAETPPAAPPVIPPEPPAPTAPQEPPAQTPPPPPPELPPA